MLPTTGSAVARGVTSRLSNKRDSSSIPPRAEGFMLPSHTFLANFYSNFFPRHIEAMDVHWLYWKNKLVFGLSVSKCFR